MKKIQTFKNENLELNRTATIFKSDTLPGFKPTFEVSTNSGGVDVEWQFQTFGTLEDAQIYAIQFIMPNNFLCKYMGD